jgi:prepilin-type N-terminal cleavage/methylation domain-containing protein
MMTNNLNKTTVLRSSRTGGFTLIELLVVIALTVVLLALIFAPLIQAFNFTAQAQATAQAQDAARSTTEELSRELASAEGVRDTTSNFLDLWLLNKSGTAIMSHAYNAYLDIIPPKISAGTIVDPTVDKNNPTLNVGSTGIAGINQEFSGSGVTLPLAAGSTVIRWFIGPRYVIDPRYAPSSPTVDNGTGQYGTEQPYANTYEGMFVSSSDTPYSNSYVAQQRLNNTYQLYRVNFQPYIQYESGMLYGTPAAPTAGSYEPNVYILPTVNNQGVTPIYDDPDFFRIVASGETDYVAGQGDNGVYTTTTAEAHNFRVYNWFKIAKPVISTREIDLAGLTRLGNKVVYDSQGNPVDSYESDGKTPILRTTVSFAPALISNDPMAATNTSNASQAYGATPPSQETALPYVPSQYSAEYGNWQGTPSVTIAKAGTTGTVYYQTGIFPASSTTTYTLGLPNYSSGQTNVLPGDLVLYELNANGTAGAPPDYDYDITAGAPVVPSGAAVPPTYDALMLDETTGAVSFAIPALPPLLNGQSTALVPPNTYWFYKSEANGTVDLVNDIDTTKYGTTPAPTSPLAQATGTGGVPHAEIVVNSERVVGPDMVNGLVGQAPNTDMVQYTRINSADVAGNLADNTYTINYQTNQIQVKEPNLELQIAYSYQNNLAVANSSVVADTIRASYYTASLMRLNLGIRVYGANTGVSDYFSLNSQVGVGNSKAN